MKCLISVSLVLFCVGYAKSCRCDGVPTNGCRSEYSILGLVLGSRSLGTPPNDERIYTVWVRRIYKEQRPISAIIRVRWYVGGHLCGISLRPGELYVISGNYGDRFFTTNSCLYTRPYNGIPPTDCSNIPFI
uniref:Uncharacterized protein LOC111106476 n=1 Tax=Crassostrea virginica TaxID=6565 RepID=A0A8B8B1I0_CRAVI|nr:uncharacterized protein LOC111106476 [Crassostrea virginica]